MRKLRFSKRLFIYIVGISMVVLLICTALITNRMTKILEKNNQLTSEQTMGEAVTSFQKQLKTLSLPIDLMCRNNNFKKIDEDYDGRISNVEDSLLSALKVIPNSERAYYNTASGLFIRAKLVVDENGKKTGDYAELKNVNRSDENWYNDALGLKGRNTVFSNFTVPYVNEDGVRVFTVSQDIKASDVHIGVIAMDVNASVLEESIETIKLLNYGYSMLLDKDGNIIIDNPNNNIIKNPSADIPIWTMLCDGVEKYAEENADSETMVNPYCSGTFKLNGQTYCATLIKDSISGWYFLGLISNAELSASFRAINAATFVSIIIAFILSTLVAYSIARVLSFELKKLQAATQRMAAGNLAEQLVVKRQDEFGELENNFNLMMDSMSALIKDVSVHSEEMYEIAKSVLKTTDDTQNIVAEVTNAIESVALGTTKQAQSTAEATTEVDKLANNIELSNNKTGAIGKQSKDTEQIGKNGIRVLDELIAKADKAKENASESIETMSEMLKSIEKINFISDAIADITSQTNLLSLNASIEAARAGESGKGFAVVADEIRKLAEQSNQSTEEIKQIVGEIATNSTRVENQLKENGNIQSQQQEVIKQTQEMFENIESAVDTLMGLVTEIEGLNDEMSTAKDNVVTRMENIAGISENSAALSQQVNSSAEMMNESINQITENARELNEIADKLRTSINKFTF